MHYLLRDDMRISKKRFYILSFTWGFWVTLCGCILAFLFLLFGYRPKRFGYCYYFESKRLKGGFNAGIFIFVCGGASKRMLYHEHGHSLQNCLYGPAMPFLVSIPSTIRYHYRKIRRRINRNCYLPPYDSIWFEKEATRFGRHFFCEDETLEKE